MFTDQVVNWKFGLNVMSQKIGLSLVLLSKGSENFHLNLHTKKTFSSSSPHLFP